jgi:hypothetical protein
MWHHWKSDTLYFPPGFDIAIFIVTSVICFISDFPELIVQSKFFIVCGSVFLVVG